MVNAKKYGSRDGGATAVLIRSAYKIYSNHVDHIIPKTP